MQKYAIQTDFVGEIFINKIMILNLNNIWLQLDSKWTSMS